MGDHSKPEPAEDGPADAVVDPPRGATMWTKTFWLDAGERAARAFAQALLSLWVVGGGFNILTVSWGPALGVSLGATVLSLLMSVVSSGVGDKGTASLIPSGD
jgi:hypothetical protein